jgi:nicotinamidase/pyrazinamidase
LIYPSNPVAVVLSFSNPLIDSYSAFFENDRTTATGLDGYIKSLGIEKINLVGLVTDFCVNYSAQDAAKLGYKVSVFEGMCRAIDLNGSLEQARIAMRDSGVELI